MPMPITTQVLSTIGLAMGMIGVALIFLWGSPLPDFSEEVGLALENNTVLADGTKVADIVRENQQRKRRHQRIARTGLALIFLGFALQLVSIWMPYPRNAHTPPDHPTSTSVSTGPPMAG